MDDEYADISRINHLPGTNGAFQQQGGMSLSRPPPQHAPPSTMIMEPVVNSFKNINIAQPSYNFLGQHIFLQRTALARGDNSRDHSDLLKNNAKNVNRDLSVSFSKFFYNTKTDMSSFFPINLGCRTLKGLKFYKNR